MGGQMEEICFRKGDGEGSEEAREWGEAHGRNGYRGRKGERGGEGTGGGKEVLRREGGRRRPPPPEGRRGGILVEIEAETEGRRGSSGGSGERDGLMVGGRGLRREGGSWRE